MVYTRIRNRIHTIIYRLKGCRIGNRSAIWKGAHISNCKNVTLGDDTTIYSNTSIHKNGKGTMIMGNHSHIAPYGYLLIGENSVRIGDDTAIGPFCCFVCSSNSPYGENKLFRENYHNESIVVGSNVFMGAHCTVMPGTVIEDNVVVAANSVVSKILENGYIYGGSPAVKIKKIEGQ